MIPALNNAENEIVNTILRAKRKIEAAMPDDMEPKEVLGAIRAICGMMTKNDRVHGKLLAALGRLMLITGQHPEIWQEAGYESYKEFIKVELTSKLGRSRQTLYDCRRIMKCFPNLDMEVYGRVPTNSLLLLTKFTNSANRDADKLLEKAADTPHEEFKTWLVDKGYLGSEDVAGGDFIRVTGPLPEIRRIKKKLANELLHAHVGSAEAWQIISAALISLEMELKSQ